MINITHISQNFLHNGGAEIFLRDFSTELIKHECFIRQSICVDVNRYNKEFCNTFPHPVIVGGRSEIQKAILNNDVIICWGHIKLNTMNLSKPRLCIFNACAEVPEQIRECDQLITNIIACSNKTANAVALNYHHKVIYPGINTSKFSITEDRKSLRAKLGVEENCFLVGMIARTEFQKRQHWLIDCVNKLQCDNIKAIFVGDGPALQQYKQKGGKNCIFVGHQSDVSNWWNIIDAYCLLSEKEGCSAALFESMYFKVPIISTPVGSAQDFLNDTNSIVVNSESELMSVISSINHKLNLKEMADNCHKTFQIYGSIETTAYEWSKYIKLCLKKQFI